MSQKLEKKNFELCQVFMLLNCFKYFLIYILGHLFQKKSDKENILNYIKSSCIIFCVKINRYSQRFKLYQVEKYVILSNCMHTKSITQ